MTEVKAARHQIFFTDEELQEVESDLQAYYPQQTFPGNPRGTGGVGLRLLDDAGRALFLRNPALAKRFYTVALEAISAGARAQAAGIGVEIEFEVDGKRYHGAADQPSDLVYPAKYVRALTFAIALRAPGVADDLIAITLDDIAKVGANMDEAFVRYAEAWRCLWQGDPSTARILEEADTLFDPSMLTIADPKAAAQHAANIPVMWALLARDEVRFNSALVGAIEAHKAWWGRGSRLNDPEGLVANQSLALGALALQRGLAVTVDSDYIPRWFVEGRDPQ